jgi:hypothetical protein
MAASVDSATEMGRVEVDDGAHLRPPRMDGEMEEALLRRLVAAERRAVRCELGDPRRVEPAEAGIGRRDQDAVVKAGRDVAARTDAVAAVVERLPDGDDLLAEASFGLGLGAAAIAPAKKSPPPELPDLSASASGSESTVVHHL